jgi:transketolase
MINAHAGVETGEDGPTHADPHVLQLLQENFPKGVLITLTPWDAQEIWPLVIAGLKARPAVLCPFVTRPKDTVIDREQYGLPPASAAVNGVYAIRMADASAKQQSGTIVLQGNGVTSVFVQEVLPKLAEKGLNLNIFYIASVELFDMLPPAEQEKIFPEQLRNESMGITDFTLPTLYRWVRSNDGIRRTLHSFRGNHYLGSGQAVKVLEEAGIHAEGQLRAILDYAQSMEKGRTNGDGEMRPAGTGIDEKVIRETIWLVCDNCGAKVDPVKYFAEVIPPDGEICAECEYRNSGICANCLAYWTNNNPGVKFYCKTCDQ